MSYEGMRGYPTGMPEKRTWLRDVVVGLCASLLTAFVLGILGLTSSRLNDAQALVAAMKLRDDVAFQSLIAEQLLTPAGQDGDQAKIAADVAGVLISDHQESIVNAMRASGQFRGSDGTPGIDVPVGGIIAWPGPLPESPEFLQRWHICNGDLVDYNPELWRVLSGLYENESDETRIGQIRVPNFRNMFLRGQGSLAAELGVGQPDTTRMPRQAPFGIKGDEGTHGHILAGRKGNGTGAVHFPGAGDDGGEDVAVGGRISEGVHTHTIAGGDDESRPKNYGVYWLIRVK